MQRYLSLHISGFSDVIKDALHRRFSDVKILEQSDDLVVYETDAPIGKVNHSPFFSNTYLLIKSFSDISVNDVLEELVDLPLDKKLSNVAEGDSFRIYVAQEGPASTTNHLLLERIEKNVSGQLGLIVHRAKPYWEFWIITRSNRKAYFSLKLTYHPSYDKSLVSGDLRPDLASLLCYVSDPQKSDIFLDPMCGNGAIPLIRAEIGKFSRIYGMDADINKIANLRETFKLEKVVFEAGDVSKKLPLVDGSVNKVVTHLSMLDPDLTDEFLSESGRLLQKEGVLVAMVGEDSPMFKLFEQRGFALARSYDIYLSGKNGTVVKLIRH